MLPLFHEDTAMGRRAFVREQILDAAFDLIATEGYEAVSSRAIATKAGVGSASMFKHFPTKADLGHELYRVALAPVLSAVADIAASQPSARATVIAFVHLLYRLYDERPRALALLVFPPHEFTPLDIALSNPASPRATLLRLLGNDSDLAAIVWGAMTGPIQDRYLHSRSGKMLPHAEAHAQRIVALLTMPTSTTLIQES
jgi:AcrR family transcriptional regulator